VGTQTRGWLGLVMLGDGGRATGRLGGEMANVRVREQMMVMLKGRR